MTILAGVMRNMMMLSLLSLILVLFILPFSPSSYSSSSASSSSIVLRVVAGMTTNSALGCSTMSRMFSMLTFCTLLLGIDMLLFASNPVLIQNWNSPTYTFFLPCYQLGVMSINWPDTSTLIDQSQCYSAYAVAITSDLAVFATCNAALNSAMTTPTMIQIGVASRLVTTWLNNSQCMYPGSLYVDQASGIVVVACTASLSSVIYLDPSTVDPYAIPYVPPTPVSVMSRLVSDMPFCFSEIVNMNGLTFAPESGFVFIGCGFGIGANNMLGQDATGGIIRASTALAGGVAGNITTIAVAECMAPQQLKYDAATNMIYAVCLFSVVVFSTSGTNVTIIMTNVPFDQSFSLVKSSITNSLYIGTVAKGIWTITMMPNTNTAISVRNIATPDTCLYTMGIGVMNDGAIDTVFAGCVSSSPHIMQLSSCSIGAIPNATAIGLCSPCARGSYATLAGSLSCSLCIAGYYANSTGASSCAQCEPGSYSTSAGSSSCTRCNAGMVNSQYASPSPAYCISCVPGKYQSQTGQTVCKDCLFGEITPAGGYASCISCAPGYYNNITSSYACTACPINYYQPINGAKDASQCVPCPPPTPFSIIASTDASQCKSTTASCHPGVISTVGQTICSTQCAIGSMCMSGVSSLCDAGSYSNSTGSGQCTSCGQGQYSTVVGSTSSSDCQLCPTSTWASAVASSACQLCVVGTVSPTMGAIGPKSCTSMRCVTQQDLVRIATSPPSSSPSSLIIYSQNICPLGATESILLNGLFTVGPSLITQFQASLMMISTSTMTNFTSTSAAPFLIPVRQSPSLRIAAFGSDAILSSVGADTSSATTSSGAVSTGSSSISSTILVVLLIAFIVLACVPLIFYRLIPAHIVEVVDIFNYAHRIPLGGGTKNQPTQLGAAFTGSFVCIAVLLTIYLATASNTVSSSALVPHSAAETTNFAVGNIQITVRAFTGAASLSSFCSTIMASSPYTSIASVASAPIGFSNVPAFRSFPSGQSCTLAADCIGCSMSSTSSISFVFPYNAQLIEWEVWISAGKPNTWTRYYGLQSQVQGSLLDQQGDLTFSTIDSYYNDHTTKTNSSGFELDFTAYYAVVPQNTSSYSSQSTVGLNFVFGKQSILFQTDVIATLSSVQIISVILSTVVSLASVFAIVFAIVELYLVHKMLKSTSGTVSPDHVDNDGNIINTDNHHHPDHPDHPLSDHGISLAVRKFKLKIDQGVGGMTFWKRSSTVGSKINQVKQVETELITNRDLVTSSRNNSDHNDGDENDNYELRSSSSPLQSPSHMNHPFASSSTFVSTVSPSIIHMRTSSDMDTILPESTIAQLPSPTTNVSHRLPRIAPSIVPASSARVILRSPSLSSSPIVASSASIVPRLSYPLIAPSTVPIAVAPSSSLSPTAAAASAAVSASASASAAAAAAGDELTALRLSLITMQQRQSESEAKMSAFINAQSATEKDTDNNDATMRHRKMNKKDDVERIEEQQEGKRSGSDSAKRQSISSQDTESTMQPK